MGQGLALALGRARHPVALISRTSHPVVPPLALHAGPRQEAVRGSDVVLLAVPDDAIGSLADSLAQEAAVTPRHVVLHLSGLLDRTALKPLDGIGAGLGSFHPLQTVAEPSTAAERLAGAYAGIEGDDRAVAVGHQLATDLGMVPVHLTPSAKPSYHAGAAVAANYTTVLAGLAERLAVEAGIAPETARRLYLPLLRGAIANLELGPAAALTGPVRRGDSRTIAAHLAALSPEDRALYRGLAREALRLAREAGLDPAAADRVARVLEPQQE